MRKVMPLLFSILILSIMLFFIANKKTTTLIGVNYVVTEHQIPLYLKIYNFYERHYKYKNLVKAINENSHNTKDIVLNTTKWVNNNIRKIPEGIDIVDHHPLTIFERRFGTEDQFSDLLSVLLVYSNVDSFFIQNITLFKVRDYWTVIDPYYGIFFTNEDRFFASIKDLKKGNWQIYNLKLEKINNLNLKSTFENKFNDYDIAKDYYDKIFKILPTDNIIDNSTKFERGGRSYIQNPLGRLKFQLYRIFLKKR